jgi:hypothetical protein
VVGLARATADGLRVVVALFVVALGVLAGIAVVQRRVLDRPQRGRGSRRAGR